MPEKPMDQSPSARKEVSKLLIREKLSEYLNKSEKLNSLLTEGLQGKLRALLAELENISDGELKSAIEAIRRDALSVMEGEKIVTPEFKLATEIRLGLGKF